MKHSYFTISRRVMDEQHYDKDGLIITKSVLTSGAFDNFDTDARNFIDKIYNVKKGEEIPERLYLYCTGVSLATATIIRAWYHWHIRVNNHLLGMSTMHYNLSTHEWVEMVHF